MLSWRRGCAELGDKLHDQADNSEGVTGWLQLRQPESAAFSSDFRIPGTAFTYRPEHM